MQELLIAICALVLYNNLIIQQQGLFEERDFMKKTLYIIMAFIGFAFIAFAVCPILTALDGSVIGMLLTDDIFNNIIISLGCGIITSTLVSFFIEYSNRNIERERSMKMKKNILNDLLEIIKNYNDEDFEFIKIEQLIKSNLLTEISSSCELYIPMGIQFYDDEELKALKSLYYSSKSLYELMQQESTLELYAAYEGIFSEAVNWSFEHGPYSEEENIKNLCRILKLAISDIQACKIGETLYFYKLQNYTFKKSLDKFKYLLEPEKERAC